MVPAGAVGAAAGRPAGDRAALAGLFLLALALRLAGIRAGLPEVYEEAYPFKVAWGMWGWGPGREFDPNPHWFKYPGLTIYLQFLGQALLYLVLSAVGVVHSALDFRLLYQLDKTPFYLTGRSITALVGAATVLPVFLLARRVAGRGAAIAAGLLVAVSPSLIAKSQVIEVDVPLTMSVALGLLAAVRLAEGLTRRRALVAGLVAGLAVTAKYPGLMLGVPCLVAVALGARAAAGARRAGDRRRARIAIAWPAAIAWGALALLATVFAASPYLFLDHRAALADLAVEREHMRLGHFGAGLGPTWLSYLREWFASVAGWTLAPAALAGLVLFLGARRAPWALVTGSFVVAYAGLVSSFAMKADRYLLPLLPPAIVFACALVGEVSARLARAGRPGGGDPGRAGRRRGTARRGPAGSSAAGGPARAEGGPEPGRGAPHGPRGRLALVAATGILLLPSLIALPAQRERLRPDTRTLARAWIEAHVPAGSFLASEQYGPPLLGSLELQAIDPDLPPALRQRGWQPRLYAVVSVPLFQVVPERSAPFYDPALYRIADGFIVTGSVRDRYRAEPARFATQLALYDTLAASWELWQAFASRGGPGPDIFLYRNPAHSRPFAERRPTPGPLPTLAAGAPTGGEAYFHYNLGLNHEVFGFLGHALRAYVEGMRFAAHEPASATACAERAAGVLERLGRRQEAAALLERAAREALRPADAARLRARLAGEH